MGISPLVFTGISKFSQDFQTIVSRTVAIASLPMKALQADQVRLLEQKNAFGELKLATASLASSLRSAGTLGNDGARAVKSSSTKVGAAISSASQASQGLYLITDITSLASRAAATSSAGVASKTGTPIAGPGLELELVVGGSAQTVTLGAGENNLEGIRNRINALGAGVTASILDTGDPAAPFFLTLTAVNPGAKDIELRTTPGDSGTNLLAQTAPGSATVFKVNGQTVSADTPTVSGVIPGISLTLNQLTAAGETVSISVDPSTAPLTSALAKFVSAYNSLSDVLAKHTGENAGILAGDPLLNSIRGAMRSVFGLPGNGQIQSLADIGLSVDNSGVLKLDEGVLAGASPARLKDALAYVSAESNGLGSLAKSFDQFSLPIAGLIDQRLFSYDETDRRIEDQLGKMERRINAMQSTLLAQLQAADALLAQLESQQGMLDAATKSLNFTLYGRQQD